MYDFFVGEDFCEKNRSLANDKNHISEMARGQGAAARAAKALKAEAKSLAPPVDQDQVVKKPRGRPPKVKRDTAQSVNELCMENGDGYAEGTHIHLSLSHAVLWFFMCCSSLRLREEGQEDQSYTADRCSRLPHAPRY